LKPANKRKVLIITSSCGGGLLQAAIAKEQELLANDPTVIIVKRDMVKDWYWKIIGKFALFAWDSAQRKGNVFALEALLNMQGAADRLFWLQIFSRSLRTFFKEEVDHVIDTQCLGTSAILRALRVYNRFRKKLVLLEKVVVDLPTEKNTHFFRSIKGLSKKNRQLLRPITIKPLLKEGQTSEQFWRENCNLSEREVIYEYFAIRQAFRKFQKIKRETEGDFSFSVHFHNLEEKKMFSRVIERGTLRADLGEKDARLWISPQDRIITILLGSQPAEEATLGYVTRLIRLASEPLSIRTPIHLLVFCGHHKVGQNSLLRQVSSLVVHANDYPAHLTVVPLGFQTDETVASVFYRSDITCTRSGGQTAMELMCVMQGEIWIHSEAKKTADQDKDLSLDQLLRGIPGWEAGNAVYLAHFRKAKIVTPETFVPFGRKALGLKNTSEMVHRNC
jgi:hypothetical protein